MQLAINQAFNSRTNLHMKTQHQQPLDVEALIVAFANSISTASRKQVDDFYRKMGQPNEKALLQQLVRSSPQHPQIRTAILILANVYEIGKATYDILQERVRIMLNWSIDIEAKEPLHQGFVHVITLSNAHRERVDLLLGEMGQLIVQIASDPAKEDYQSSPVDLGESTTTLKVRHPENFPSLASTYIKLLFWRFRATGFIIEPYQMETIACYAPFTALIRFVISEDGLSHWPTVISDIFDACFESFESVNFQNENQYCMFMRHIFETWSSMNSSFELIYQAGCRHLSEAFNYLQADQHLQLKIQAAQFHLIMLEKEQKIKTSFPLVNQLSAIVPSIVVTLSSLLEESDKDWEERVELVKRLLRLLQVDIRNNPKDQFQSMKVILETIFPLVIWTINIFEKNFKDGPAFCKLQHQFSFDNSIKHSVILLINTVIKSSPNTSTLFFNQIEKSLENFFTDVQSTRSLREVEKLFFLTVFFIEGNMYQYQHLTDLLKTQIEEHKILLNNLSPENLDYLQCILYLFSGQQLSPIYLKFIEAVLDSNLDQQSQFESIFTRFGFLLTFKKRKIQRQFTSHICTYLKDKMKNRIKYVRFINKKIDFFLKKLVEQNTLQELNKLQSCIYFDELQQNFQKLQMLTINEDSPKGILEFVQNNLSVVGRLYNLPALIKLFFSIFQNTQTQQMQLITLIQLIMGQFLKQLEKSNFLQQNIVSLVCLFITLQKLHNKEVLGKIYSAFYNNLLCLTNDSESTYFLRSLQNTLLIEQFFLSQFDDKKNIQDLLKKNEVLLEISLAPRFNKQKFQYQLKIIKFILNKEQNKSQDYFDILLGAQKIQGFPFLSGVKFLSFLKNSLSTKKDLFNLLNFCHCIDRNNQEIPTSFFINRLLWIIRPYEYQFFDLFHSTCQEYHQDLYIKAPPDEYNLEQQKIFILQKQLYNYKNIYDDLTTQQQKRKEAKLEELYEKLMTDHFFEKNPIPEENAMPEENAIAEEVQNQKEEG